MATDEGLVIGDVIAKELDEEMSRQDLTIKASNTMVVGQVGCRDSTGDIVTIANANDHVWTATLAAGTDGGNFGMSYRGVAIAVQAWNVSAADLQTALRALHADLDACTVGLAGEVYTITVTHEKLPIDMGDSLQIVQDSTADGGVWEGGIHLSRSTIGEPACCVCLEAVEETSDTTAACLVRNAVVDDANVTGSSTDINNRLAEPRGADDYENSAGFGGILVRTGPTYTTLPVT